MAEPSDPVSRSVSEPEAQPPLPSVAILGLQSSILSDGSQVQFAPQYLAMTLPPYTNCAPGIYFAQRSLDLVTWTLFVTNALNTSLCVTDAIISHTQFYRTAYGTPPAIPAEN